MSENLITLTTEVDGLLSSKWAFLSGGRTTSESYIISMPCLPMEQLSNETHAQLLKYLFDIAIDHDPRAKFVFVIDRRLDKWINIKPLLSFIHDKFPDPTSRIEKIFLLQPSGVFGSLLRIVLLDLNDTRVEVLSSISDLHKKIDKSRLTSEFGGTLELDMECWIHDRRMVESIESYVEHVKTDLEALLEKNELMNSFYEEMCITSKYDLETKMTDNANSYQMLKDKIDGCRSNVKASLDYFNSHSTETMPSKMMLSGVAERLQVTLEHLKVKCQGLCDGHDVVMKKVLKMKEMSEVVDELTKKPDAYFEELNKLKEAKCSTIDEVQLNINMLRNVENSVKSSMRECENLIRDLETLTTNDKDSLLTMTNDQLDNNEAITMSLTTMGSSTDAETTSGSGERLVDRMSTDLRKRLDDVNERMNELRENINFAFKLLEKKQGAVSAMDKAVKWINKGEELMNMYSPLLDDEGSLEKISTAINELKSFKFGEEFSGFEKLQSDHSEVLDETLLNAIQSNCSRHSDLQAEISDLLDNLEIKRVEVAEIVRKRERTVQSRKLASLDNFKDNECDGEDSKSLDSLNSEDVSYDGLKGKSNPAQAKHRKCGKPTLIVDSRLISGMVMQDQNLISKLSIIQSQSMPLPGKEIPSLNNGEPADASNQSHPYLIDIKRLSSSDDMEKYIPSRLREDLIGIQPVPDSGTIRRKRSHVIQELIETERSYTADLKNIIEGYYDQFDNPELQPLIPELLLGKRDVLFGNIKDIYAFHSETFLKSLEACDCRTGDVGKCFIENKERLHFYSIYCQNKIRAEQLIEKVGDNNPFFKECQKRLNHPLPFSSYILKPVQRITKYHLLLKELVRMTTNQSESSDLKKAIMSISDVLKYVNNSMHQLSIIGFPGDLMEQGRLLMQGSLDVNVEKRKDRSPSIKQTFHRRQVFLYDRCILFCKKKEASSGLGSYVFKCSLKTDEVGPLVESPKGGDEKRFELWSRNEVWSFVAHSAEEKLDWTEEIKKVLYEQMDYIRATRKRLLVENSPQGKVTVLDPVYTGVTNEPDSLISSDLDNSNDT